MQRNQENSPIKITITKYEKSYYDDEEGDNRYSSNNNYYQYYQSI